MKDPLLERWAAIVAQRDRGSAKDWGDQPPPHFLHAFRPDGAGLDALFDGMPHGADVLARLRRVFEIAGDPGRGHAYFIVLDAPAATCRDLEALARRHLESLAAIAEALDWPGAEARAFSDRDLELEIVVGAPPPDDPARPHAMATAAYELITEYGGSFAAPSRHGEYLLDPLYYLACDYALAYYVLWPHLRTRTALDDPFAPWFELWRHGATLGFDGAPGTVRVYVPRTSDAPPTRPRATRPTAP